MSQEHGDREAGRDFAVFGLIATVWQYKRLVLGGVLVSGVLAIVIALIFPRSYEATATVFPVSSSSSSTLSQYASLASLAGVALPETSGGVDPGKTVKALLSSRSLVERLVTELDLVDQLDIPSKSSEKSEEERFDAVVEKVRRNLKTDEDSSTGVISISLSFEDPLFAQTTTNRLLEVLDKMLVEKSLTTSRKKSESLEKQIAAQRVKVNQLQEEMAQFQRDTDLLDPRTQAGKVVDAYTEMVQQKMSLELQLASAEAAYSKGNPRIALLKNQVENLEAQIQRVRSEVGGDLPSLTSAPENLIRYQNLFRDLEIATKIYAGLLASLEQTRIEDDKDQVYIEVLDNALLPRQGSPSKLLVAVFVLFLGTALVIVTVLGLDWYRHLLVSSRSTAGSTL